MSDSQLENVDFDFIRYSNLWEDADVLIKGLQINSTSRVMSIASAGDNCFALAAQGPECVIAVDVSEVQCHLTELKREAIKALDRNQFLSFIGFTSRTNRLETYQMIRPSLSQSAAKYWDKRTSDIKEGAIHVGKFERYFQLFKKDYLHKIHTQEVVDELFQEKTEIEQKSFHDEVWHTPEWKEMYGVFFGEKMMGDKGRDPEFLKYVQGSVADITLAKEIEHLRSVQCQNNYFLHYILYNKFREDMLPYYVREENYEQVKAHIDKVIIHCGLLDSALEEHGACSHFNLSDIFEYMDVPLFKLVAQNILDNSSKGARIAYWNLMIPRNIADLFPETVIHEKELSTELKKVDLGYFYDNIVINTVK